MSKLGCCIPGGSFMPQGVASTGGAPLDNIVAGCGLVMNRGSIMQEVTVGAAMALSDQEAERAATENHRIRCFNGFIPGKYKILNG